MAVPTGYFGARSVLVDDVRYIQWYKNTQLGKNTKGRGSVNLQNWLDRGI